MTDIPNTRTLSPCLTSYDLIKAFAVISMVIDHTGAYFFPDENWWRAIGRLCFPIWFFLIGFSQGRSITPVLIGGAAALTFMNFVTGRDLFPLNALVTIIMIRLVIDNVMTRVANGKVNIWVLSLGLYILSIPTMLAFEYGTQALIAAMFGYIVRHRAKFKNQKLAFQYMWFSFITFVLAQQILFGFTPAQFAFMLFGTLLVRMCLYNFRAEDFPRLTSALPVPLRYPIFFMGRHTLEIYVVHLCLFKLAAPYYLGEPIPWFQFSLLTL